MSADKKGVTIEHEETNIVIVSALAAHYREKAEAEARLVASAAAQLAGRAHFWSDEETPSDAIGKLTDMIQRLDERAYALRQFATKALTYAMAAEQGGETTIDPAPEAEA